MMAPSMLAWPSEEIPGELVMSGVGDIFFVVKKLLKNTRKQQQLNDFRGAYILLPVVPVPPAWSMVRDPKPNNRKQALEAEVAAKSLQLFFAFFFFQSFACLFTLPLRMSTLRVSPWHWQDWITRFTDRLLVDPFYKSKRCKTSRPAYPVFEDGSGALIPAIFLDQGWCASK